MSGLILHCRCNVHFLPFSASVSASVPGSLKEVLQWHLTCSRAENIVIHFDFWVFVLYGSHTESTWVAALAEQTQILISTFGWCFSQCHQASILLDIYQSFLIIFDRTQRFFTTYSKRWRNAVLLFLFVFAQGRDWCSSSTLKPSQRCLAPPSGPSSSSSCCWRWASTVRWAPPTSTHFCSDNSPVCNHPVLRQHSLDLIQSKWK